MTTNNPLVSVILPVYNGERYLAEAIESVLAQTYRPVELIAVDDGSTDGTAEIAKSYSDVRYLHQPNQGNGRARNAGLKAAQGDLIALLDADDLWLENKLHTQVEHLRQHPELGYVVCRMHPFLEPGTDWPPHLNRDHYQSDPPLYTPSALLAWRWVFERVGMFDARYVHGNDSDWLFRARDADIPMAVVPRVLLRKRIHGQNLSHDTGLVTRELLQVLHSSLRRRRKGDA